MNEYKLKMCFIIWKSFGMFVVHWNNSESFHPKGAFYQETMRKNMLNLKHLKKNRKFSNNTFVLYGISIKPLWFENNIFYECSVPTRSGELCISEVCMNAAWRRLWWWLITLSGNRSGSGQNRGDPRDFFLYRSQLNTTTKHQEIVGELGQAPPRLRKFTFCIYLGN